MFVRRRGIICENPSFSRPRIFLNYDLIRTFWYWLAMVIVGALTWIFLIGGLILLLATIWLAIRAAVGLIRLVDGRPHPDPTGFWI